MDCGHSEGQRAVESGYIPSKHLLLPGKAAEVHFLAPCSMVRSGGG